jgi:hypothetical protein
VLGASAGVLLMMAVWVFLREGLVPCSPWLICVAVNAASASTMMIGFACFLQPSPVTWWNNAEDFT